MHRSVTDFGACTHENFNRSVVQTCFSFVRHIVVYISYGTVGIRYYENMWNKSGFCIISEQYSLQRSFNYDILRNIEEYSAVPKRRMQRSNRMLARQYGLMQITLHKIAMFFDRCLQIGKDHSL
ncbi:hypothetical protein D3C74_424000 [compost metagenome]